MGSAMKTYFLTKAPWPKNIFLGKKKKKNPAVWFSGISVTKIQN